MDYQDTDGLTTEQRHALRVRAIRFRHITDPMNWRNRRELTPFWASMYEDSARQQQAEPKLAPSYTDAKITALEAENRRLFARTNELEQRIKGISNYISNKQAVREAYKKDKPRFTGGIGAADVPAS